MPKYLMMSNIFHAQSISKKKMERYRERERERMLKNSPNPYSSRCYLALIDWCLIKTKLSKAQIDGQRIYWLNDGINVLGLFSVGHVPCQSYFVWHQLYLQNTCDAIRIQFSEKKKRIQIAYSNECILYVIITIHVYCP